MSKIFYSSINSFLETDGCSTNPCKPPAVCEIRDNMLFCNCPKGFENKGITECQGFSYALLIILIVYIHSIRLLNMFWICLQNAKILDSM